MDAYQAFLVGETFALVEKAALELQDATTKVEPIFEDGDYTNKILIKRSYGDYVISIEKVNASDTQ